MRLVSRLPINIDYILGALMVLAGIYTVINDGTLLLKSGVEYELIFRDLAPYLELLTGGVILILLPRKNLRRTIWTCAFILGVNALLLGLTLFITIYPAIGEILIEDPSFSFVVIIYTASLIFIGSSIALLSNSVLYAKKRISSIYPSIFAVILVIAADIMLVMQVTSYTTNNTAQLMAVYGTHMALFASFMLLFTSDEVSWYTAKGDMLKALNRLKTSYATYDIPIISREKLVILMQATGDYSMRLHRDKYAGLLEVTHSNGRTFLAFGKFGAVSMAGAMHLELEAVVLPDTLSMSRFVDVYAKDGRHIRLEINEPKRRLLRPDVFGHRVFHGMIENFNYTVSNASLYHLVDGEGEERLVGLNIGDPLKLRISGTGNERYADVVRPGGSIMERMHVLAVVPVAEYGTYTKVFIYGDMGRYMAFKVAPPVPGRKHK